MQITHLLETIRLKFNPEENFITIYNLNLHLERLLKSLLNLNFKPPIMLIRRDFQDINLTDKFYTLILDYISKEIKNYFSENFSINNIVINFFNGSFNYNNQEKNIYKLRLIYDIDGNIKSDISIYERFLENNIIFFSISKNFQINCKDRKWQYKFFPREEINLKKLINTDSERVSENKLDEIIWTNEKNEICEGSFTNIFLRKEKTWITTHLDSNLLNGTMRKILINELKASEEKCYIENIILADEIILCNSMIGKAKAKLINKIN